MLWSKWWVFLYQLMFKLRYLIVAALSFFLLVFSSFVLINVI